MEMIMSSAKSISIVNGRIKVNGFDVTPENEKQITIIVEGDCDRVDVDSCEKVTVKGSTGSVTTASGDVEVGGAVGGPITTASGDVNCGDVSGSVTTASGDVDAKSIAGSVKTMSGDISHG